MIADDLLESFRVEEIHTIHNRPGAPVGKVPSGRVKTVPTKACPKF